MNDVKSCEQQGGRTHQQVGSHPQLSSRKEATTSKAVNDVKSCEQQVHKHTRKMEAVHIEFEEGGSTSKAVNDVKSS